MTPGPEPSPAGTLATAETAASLPRALEHGFRTHQHRLALLDHEKSWSFGELWHHSSIVAERIKELAPVTPTPVAFRATASASSFVAILGILRSGRAYVPLPADASKVLIRERMSIAGARHLIRDDGLIEMPHRSESGAADLDAEPVADDANLVTVMFTSASTGAAKGVKLPGRSVLFHAGAYARHLDIKAGELVSFFPSLHAGVSISNLFGPWLAGAGICLVSPVRDGIAGALEKIIRQHVPVLHMVPSVFRALAAHPDARRAFDPVRLIKLGGETVFGSDRVLFSRIAGRSARLVNGLGITEAGGNITFGEVPEWDPAEPVPIGKPVDGLAVRLISSGDAEEGELVLRGRYLSSGYAGQPHHPAFENHEDGSTSFQTGDWVRRRPDGSLIHAGRTDSMTKIGGTLVSPAGIEAALRARPDIEECCVLVDDADPRSKKLVAAIKTNTPVTCAGLLAGLEGHLSRDHRPGLFYVVQDWPRLPGGKTDRAALKEKIRNQAPMGIVSGEPPGNRREFQLLSLWRASLGVPQLGIHDDIFALGIHSLAVAELIDKMQRDLGITITPQTLLQARSVHAVAYATAGQSASTSEPPPSPVVLLRGGGSRHMLVIPGAGSTVFSLMDLAHAIPGDFSVYGLQYPGIDEGHGYRSTVEEIARYFIGHITRALPDQPFGLCGTSFGGMVAFEMARQLEQAGRPPRFLGMIDTYAPGYLNPRSGGSMAKAVDILAFKLRPIGAKDVSGLKNGWRGIKEKVVLLRARGGFWSGGRPASSHAERMNRLLAASMTASRRYRISAIETPVDFFFVEDRLRPDLFPEDKTLGWRDASRGGIRTIRIPGKHGQHIRHPHVIALGRKLGEAALFRSQRA